MARARRYFEDLGYAVADVHQSQPYDLECSKAGDIRCCEVKATTTLGVEVLLTPNEVRFARENKARMVLYVLHSVSVEEHESKAVAQGGEPFVVWPWDVDSGALEPLGYSHTVPGDRHRLAAPQ